MDVRTRWRRLSLGLATITGIARRGWFIPHRYAATLPAPGAVPAYEAVAALFDRARGAFAEHLAAIEAQAGALAAIAAEAGRPADGTVPNPRFDQGWFAPLDAAAAYALLRARRPRRVFEVGSGHSTRFLARAAHDGGFDCDMLAVDPAPRAAIERLAPRVRLLRQTAQQAGASAFAGLGPGDVLFIDSSHILMPGSDVDFLFNRIVPALPAGALLHVHDIFLPDDYPPAWGWRGYNEQQVLPGLLLGGVWRPLFASHFMASREAAAVAGGIVGRLPHAPESIPASLWLEKLQ